MVTFYRSHSSRGFYRLRAYRLPARMLRLHALRAAATRWFLLSRPRLANVMTGPHYPTYTTRAASCCSSGPLLWVGFRHRIYSSACLPCCFRYRGGFTYRATAHRFTVVVCLQQTTGMQHTAAPLTFSER